MPNRSNDEHGAYTGQDFNRYQAYTPDSGIDLREAAKISSGFIIFGWIVWWPLGLFLTVIKHIGKKQQEEAARWMRSHTTPGYAFDYTDSGMKARGTAARRTSTYQSPYITKEPPQPKAPKAQKAPKAAKKQKGGGFWPNVLMGVGIFAAFVGLVSIFDPLYYLTVYGFNRHDLWEVFSNLGWIGSGAAMMLGSRFFKKRNRLWKRMKAVVGDKDHMSVAEITAALSAGYKATLANLENAIDHGVFGPDAYLDMRSRCLVVRGPAPEPEQQPEEKAAPAPAAAESQYESVLRQLREINDAIPGEEMSAKIDRLEAVTAKIFDLAEKEPDKLPQMRRFMDYYLPTALKLLRSYAEFDSQGVDGAYISDSKKKIEETMDVLVVGFEQQLDKLFQDEALDVSADISVLQNMMAQDGLNGESSPFSL